jgi:hypothetical protein
MQVWTPANYTRRLSPDRNEAVIFLAFSLAFCLVLSEPGCWPVGACTRDFGAQGFESQTVPYLGMVPIYAGASVDIKLKGSDSSLSALRIYSEALLRDGASKTISPSLRVATALNRLLYSFAWNTLASVGRSDYTQRAREVLHDLVLSAYSKMRLCAGPESADGLRVLTLQLRDLDARVTAKGK